MDLFNEFEDASIVDASSVTLAELDNHIKELLELEKKYTEAKKVAYDINIEVEKKENFILGLLSAINRNSYEAEGLAKITKCVRTSYKVPKDTNNKKELFKYIEDKYGDETLMGLVTINSMTLNSWANREIAEDNVSFIPGLEAPTSNEYIQIRRSK